MVRLTESDIIRDMMRLRPAYLMLIALLLSWSTTVSAKDDAAIWHEFVERLKEGNWSREDIRPYDASLTDALIGFLQTIKQTAAWDDFEKPPEIFRQERLIHFLTTVRLDGNEQTLCFTILQDDDRWYFQHLESIFIRLDKLDSLPASVFPDISESTKAWMREEIRISNRVRLFNYLVEKEGRDFAFTWFNDGPGYFLSARTWVPFLENRRAFILYLCWVLANLRGNELTLEKLEDREARVRLQPMYFQLYERTAHLRTQIGFQDYRQLFETVWHDRARAAGWDLSITYEADECVFSFTRGN